MLDIPQHLARELKVEHWQIRSAMELFAEGATVPFVARYRKERTGGLDEVVLRALLDRHRYLTELEARKEVILKSIDEQGKLTPELRAQIEGSEQKAELEDLYLPYRPRRRTRATIAREKGLDGLADWVRLGNRPGRPEQPLHEAAAAYVRPGDGVASVDEALQGASDILAEEVAEQAALRAYLRDYLLVHGTFVARVKDEHPVGTTQFEMYRDYRVPVRDIAAHNMLALRRGEAEGMLYFDLAFDEAHVRSYLAEQEIRADDPALRRFLEAMLEDAFQRLLKPAIVGDVRLQKKQEADETSVRTFAANLRDLLLASPAGMRPTLAIDPGFRTGCKVAVLDRTGRFLAYRTIHPHTSDRRRAEAAETLTALLEQYAVELVAIGNGTAGRETDQFVGEVLAGLKQAPIKVMVSEAGASVYSASPLAGEEFPDLDLTMRSAISIGRRLQDPLAELVKIDPKSIGVGQYQHDVDQTLLREKLEETIESCVNYVGVDLNMASAELLRYVAGITPAVARNIVAYRDTHGPFDVRKGLLDVPRFGPRTFEQAAGFLRIRDGRNPLDNTAVHPESYGVVEAIARDLDVPLGRITQVPDQLKTLDLQHYVTDTTGLPTLHDILAELEKPGRDPREAFQYAAFRDDVTKITDLEPGMMLEGVVTNVTNFGAFVDIGVHRDGLVHISQLADRFVKDPAEVVKVGEVVRVRVVDVDEKLKRISLSMRSEAAAKETEEEKQKPRRRKKKQDPSYTVEDLAKKFNRR